MSSPFKPQRYIPKKHLSFNALTSVLSENFQLLPEYRQVSKTNYSVHDAMMSAFACMYFQSPSILFFQRQLNERKRSNNLKSLFGVQEIPKDSQLRELVDSQNSESLRPIFKEIISRLQRGKHLSNYQFLPGRYLIPLDGTQYHSSKSISCEHCLTKEHKDGTLSYSHSVLQAGIMHPNCRQIIPFMPEEIKNTDGTEKQDCELNAAKRLLPKLRSEHPQLGMIVVGDGLFSKQPFITDINAQRMNYILVAKPKDHTYMMEWLSAFPKLHRTEEIDEKGKKHVYEWMESVPLNGRPDATKVNYFQYKIIEKKEDGTEKVNYKNSWVTDLPLNKNNISHMVKGARCRWKIENECFNTLKNQGYEIEHNYGHGKQNLCHNFYLLTLIAFLFHQVFELTDKLFQACRKECGSKKYLWEQIRGSIKFFIFGSWESLLDIVLDPNQYETYAIKIPP